MKILARVLLIAMMVMTIVGRLEAQTPPTLDQNCSFAWDTYPVDPFAVSLKLYLTKDGAQMPAITNIPLTATSLTCKAAGVTVNGLWKANLHAVASDGKESDPSNGVSFQFVLNTKPRTPSGLKVQ